MSEYNTALIAITAGRAVGGVGLMQGLRLAKLYLEIFKFGT